MNYFTWLKFRKTIVLLVSILFLENNDTIAQKPKHSEVLTDTVSVKGDRFVFLNDSVYYVPGDTIFLIPDSVDFYVRKNNMKKTDEVYSNFENKLSKGRLSRLAYSYIFNTEENDPRGEEVIEQRFIPYENDIIRHIDFKPLPVFGSDINDTTINSPSGLQKLLNRIHVHTQERIIRKNTLFRINQKINPDDFVNTERLLRRLNYIKDARVFVDDSLSGNEKNVDVVTKDVFPYNFLIAQNSDALFGISNVNIAGIGHELQYDHIQNGGSEFFYRIRNIRGTFVDSELNYANHFSKTGYGIFATRDFVTQETKYAGGISFSDYKFGDSNFVPETGLTSDFFYDQRYENFWIGRAFNTSLTSKFIGLGKNTKTIISARWERSDFYNRPITTANSNFRYHDEKNLLLGFGLTSRAYFKDRFILQFGRTEDIPTGSALGMVLGYQMGEFKDRFYSGINYARGGYLPHFGYLNGIIALGGFYNDGLEDHIFKIDIDYFTYLQSFNQFKFRQFINLSFSQALAPNEEFILNTQEQLGIDGLENYYLGVTSRFNIQAKSLLITPINALGFRLATFAFFDYTLTSNSRNDFFGSDSYYGFGAGILLRNDNLAISTIQLRIGFYPSVPLNTSESIFNISSPSQLTIRDFDFKAPEILPFN